MSRYKAASYAPRPWQPRNNEVIIEYITSQSAFRRLINMNEKTMNSKQRKPTEMLKKIQ